MNRGLHRLKEILERGASRNQLDKWIAEGSMTHVGFGWYAEASADPRFITAARAGTRLGCTTACDAHGLWMPPNDSELHVIAGLGERLMDVEGSVLAASKGLRTPIVHRAPGKKSELICPVDEAIEQVATYHDPEIALIAIESALNQGVVDVAWVEAMLERLPQRQRRALSHFSAGSESGSETRVAQSMRKKRLPVYQQVPLFPNEHQRVDMVVGKSWVLECDSAGHHSDIRKYERDRERDLYLESLGFQVTRLSYKQVWSEWDTTQERLRSIISQRRYLRPAQIDPEQVCANLARLR